MPIEPGTKLPDATLLMIGDAGPTSVSMADKVKGRKVVIFGLPGAYTGTCTTAHVPSFLRTKDQFAAKGVEEIICVAVNDPFVMEAWGKSMGADGITFLGDADASFTKGIGMEFTAPPVGFFDRSKRYAMLVEDGEVKIVNEEPGPGECDISAGETLLDQL